MSLNRREEGLDYFTFDHSADYQRRHRHYLATRPGSPEGLDLQLLQTHMIQSMEHYHVEVMVEVRRFTGLMLGLEIYVVLHEFVLVFIPTFPPIFFKDIKSFRHIGKGLVWNLDDS